MTILWIFVGAALLYLLQRALYTRYWDAGLTIRTRFEVPAVTAGQEVRLVEQVENRKLLPLPIFGYEYCLDRNYALLRDEKTMPIRVRYRLSLPARRAVHNVTTLPPLARGIYTLADGRLEGQDLLMTAQMHRGFYSTARLVVYPAKLPAGKLALPFRTVMGTVLTRRYAQEDPFELRGIRPYEIYDSMRSINWKASARTGELKVNQHAYTTDEALLLLLNICDGTEEEQETLISMASSLSELFLRRGVSVALRSNARSCLTTAGISVPAGGGSSHQTVIDEALAQIKLAAAPTMAFADFLDRQDRRELRGFLDRKSVV